MRWRELKNQDCSVAKSLSVFGDLWTIMILRDCFLGIKNFDGFAKSLGISRSIISNRLANLVNDGILEKFETSSPAASKQYRLSPKGLSLYPIILSIVKWGDANFYQNIDPPITHIHRTCGHKLSPIFCCEECGKVVDPKEVNALQRRL